MNQQHPGGQDLPNTLRMKLASRLLLDFGLFDPGDKDVWLYCIAAAMRLERFAAGVLWIADGRSTLFTDYMPHLTLGQAHHQLETRGLLDTTTRETLKAVADLRNSVAHRHAIMVTIPSPVSGRPTGLYKGRHVFQYQEALQELVSDADSAANVMVAWMHEQAPDLRRSARARDRSPANVSPPHELGGGSGPNPADQRDR
jgi:hypothetical protein